MHKYSFFYQITYNMAGRNLMKFNQNKYRVQGGITACISTD